MPEKNQEEKLREEIMGDARLKAERIIARAKNEAQKTIAAAEAEVASKRRERLQEANEEADSKCQSILLDVQRESTRHWLLRREQCIEEMFQQALKIAAETTGKEHEASLRQLAEEALAAIEPAPMRVRFNAKDSGIITEPWLRKIADALFGENSEKASFILEADENTPTGIILETLDGARTFDNSYAARLQHTRDDLRTALG
jgi:vacuolar-type H+-ATPase subunit E/Vma4